MLKRLYAYIVRAPYPWQIRVILFRLTNLIIFKNKKISLNGYQKLRSEGYQMLEKISSEDQVKLRDEIQKYLSENDEPVIFSEDNNAKNSGIYYASEENLSNSAVVKGIVEKYKFKEIADTYLKADTTLISLGGWKSIETKHHHAVNAQNHHRDLDTLKWLKIFIYLTDVNIDNGPHVYVPKTHKMNIFLKYKRIVSSELNEKKLKEVPITGKSGDVIAVDTFGLHRGMPVERGYRIIFQMNFSTIPEAYKKYPKSKYSEDELYRYYK